VDPATREALAAIDRAVSDLRRMREQPVSLTDDYLACVRAVEDLPQNRPGTDKTWLEAAREEFRRHFAAARRV
jgi:hypothetical protein